MDELNGAEGMERAVEAALDVMCQGWRSYLPDSQYRYRSEMSRALAAADQARGRSWIDWHPADEPTDDEIMMLCQDKRGGHRWLHFGRRDHLSIPQDYVVAWFKMPSPPAWDETAPPVASAQSSEASADAQAVGSAQKTPTAASSSFTSLTVDGVPTEVRYSEQKYGGALARAATDGEDSNHPGTTHETPGAAVLAGGEKRTLPEIMRERHGNRAYRADYDGEPTKCRPDDATRLSDLELRVIALEGRPEWTEGKDHALAYALGNLEGTQRLAGHTVRADQTRQVRRAAFPEPKP